MRRELSKYMRVIGSALGERHLARFVMAVTGKDLP